MISLEGLTLCTGRHGEAAAILRTFSRYVHDGLLPNLFPEGARQALYHTVDATLWYFHAIDRYLQITGDHLLLIDLFPMLRSIIEHYLSGTHFGIHADDDGLAMSSFGIWTDGGEVGWDQKVVPSTGLPGGSSGGGGGSGGQIGW